MEPFYIVFFEFQNKSPNILVVKENAAALLHFKSPENVFWTTQLSPDFSSA